MWHLLNNMPIYEGLRIIVDYLVKHWPYMTSIWLFQHARRIKGLLNFLCYCRFTYYRSCLWHFTTRQCCVYLLQNMFVTFALPESFVCVYYRTYVYDISLPNSVVCVYYTTCLWHFTTQQCCVSTIQVMYMTFHHLTVLCVSTIQVIYLTILGIVPDINFMGHDIFLAYFL